MEYDSRILGDGDFVSEIIREAEKKVRRYLAAGEMVILSQRTTLRAAAHPPH
jgi:hypothetical protein